MMGLSRNWGQSDLEPVTKAGVPAVPECSTRSTVRQAIASFFGSRWEKVSSRSTLTGLKQLACQALG